MNLEDRKGVSTIEANLLREIRELKNQNVNLQTEIQRLKTELSGCQTALENS